MNLKSGTLTRLAIAAFVAIGAVNVWSDEQWYGGTEDVEFAADLWDCLLYTSPSPRDATLSRMPSSA